MSSTPISHSANKNYSNSWILLLALLTALGPLSIDMYLPALPEMANDFGISTQRMANTLPAYFLGLAIGQLVYGPISDRIGRKKPLYFGLILYCIVSVLYIFATTEASMIVLRVVQALGGCVGVVMARAAIRDRLDVKGSAQAFSSMMMVMGIAPIAAPALGAVILGFTSWQSIFLLLGVFGLISLLCVHFFFDETLAPSKRLRLSFNQVLTLYASIFKDRSFRFAMLAGCLTGGALFTYISSAASVFMEVYGLNQHQFAYAFGFIAAGIILFSSLNKRLVQRTTALQRLYLGGSIQFSGAVLVLISSIFLQSHFILIMAGLFFAVSGLGFTGPNSMALAMSRQGARAGTASAILGAMQFGVGLLAGILLNLLPVDPITNMGLIMLLFTGAGLLMIKKTSQNLNA